MKIVSSFVRFIRFILSIVTERCAWFYLNSDLNQRWLRTIHCCVMSLSLFISFFSGFNSLPRRSKARLLFLCVCACVCFFLLVFCFVERAKSAREQVSAMSEFDEHHTTHHLCDVSLCLSVSSSLFFLRLSLSVKHDPHDSMTIFTRTT